MPEQDQVPCIWILDEEWPDYELERQTLVLLLKGQKLSVPFL